MRLSYRQVTEVVDALRSLPKHPGRRDWQEIARTVSGVVGYRVTVNHVRSVATQTGALDASKVVGRDAPPAADLERLLTRVKHLEAAVDAGRKVETLSYNALVARLKKLEDASSTGEKPQPQAPRSGGLRGY